MKNLFFLLSFSLLFFSCKDRKTALDKSSKSFTIISDISQLNDSIIVKISKDKLHSYDRIDSMISKNGTFKVSIPSNLTAEKYDVRISKYPTNEFITSLDVWAKNEDVNISGIYDGKRVRDVVVKGSYLNTIQEEYNNIIIKCEKMLIKDYDTAKTPEAQRAVFLKLEKLIYATQLRFIYENPNNLVSLTSLFMHESRVSKDSLNLYYNKIDTLLQKSEKGLFLKKLSSVKQYHIGDYVDNFEAKDINGKIVQLDDFKGKIILLDFWASWCVPCRVQIREELSDLHKKYKDRNVVIINYSLDEESAEQKWKDASAKEGIDWLNISNLKGFNDIVARKYNVSGVPNTFIINKEGIIVKSFIGYKKGAVEKELKKLLATKS